MSAASVAAVLCAALAGCTAARTEPGVPARPVFYPLPPDPPRIQFLTAINAAWDVVPNKTGWLARFLFGERTDVGRRDVLQRPYGVAVWQGKIYVCDHRGGAVKVIDLEGKRFYQLGGDPPVTVAPTNLSIDPDGYKFIVESMQGLIHTFGPDDNYLATFRLKDARPGGVVAVGSELFVTDVTGDRILVLDRSSGKVLRTLGRKGKGPGEFIMPNAIARDAEGNLYVSDEMNFRFQKIDRDGRPLVTVGEAGDTFGSFARPRGITVGPDGITYVVESVYEVVQMFDPEGRVLMAFGNFHGAPGFLELPAGVAVDKSCLPYFAKYLDPRFEPEYLVFVTSQVGRALVGVYAFGHLRPGAEVPALPAPAPGAARGETDYSPQRGVSEAIPGSQN